MLETQHTPVSRDNKLPARLSMASLRYLGLLLLLTPLLGGVNLLLRQAASEPEVVREVIEVPQPVFVPQKVYVTVAVPTVVVVEVPVESTTSSRMVQGPLDDPLDIGQPVEPAPGVAEPAQLAEAEAEEESVDQAPPPPPLTLARRGPAAPEPVWTPPPPASAVAAAPEEAAPPAPAPVAEAPAPAEAPSGPTFAARQALADFYDFTERNWSVNGYSSAAEMRAALGNSQSDWLRRTEAAARGQ